MNLAEFKKAFKISFADLARACGCSPLHIRNIAHGIARPSLKLALLIERATDGHVPHQLLLPPKPKKTSCKRRAVITVPNVSKDLLKSVVEGWPESLSDPGLTFKIAVRVLHKPKDAERARIVSSHIQQAFDSVVLG